MPGLVLDLLLCSTVPLLIRSQSVTCEVREGTGLMGRAGLEEEMLIK